LSVADELLKANETFARNFTLGDLAVRPRRHVAVLACMDSRILFEHCLGLHPGDAHMIRNAGGIATDDALRSLIVSHHLLDTQEFIIINHTDCGLLQRPPSGASREIASVDSETHSGARICL
jgi:carbonic anhydrase